jgi:xanthine dehydrogenase accessory factor
LDLLLEMAQLRTMGKTFVCSTVVSTAGSTPQKPGAKMVVLSAGELRGSIGGGAIEKQIVDAALELLGSHESHRLVETHLTHDLAMCCGGRMTVFLEKIVPPPRLFIFGAGHVAKALAEVASLVHFEVHVVDEREDWLTAERFPSSQKHLMAPDEFARTVAPVSSDCCCVTTHDHALDQACVEKLLTQHWAYVGCIGSERKALKFRARLQAAGVESQCIARLESPMGLAVGAQSPEEIAVAIVARLIQVRAATRETATSPPGPPLSE